MRTVLGIIMLMMTHTIAPHDLINVAQAIPSVVLDIRYATTNNFTGKKVYPCAKCYLRTGTIKKLKKVQEELLGLGYSLKIWDGYRPLAVQEIFWQLVPDTRYVADPKKGSKHNRGAAVDVTLVYANNGKEVVMPSGFDDFSERAHLSYTKAPADALKHRDLLQTTMHKHGFIGLATEWWHFDDCDWNNYEVLNIPFDALV